MIFTIRSTKEIFTEKEKKELDGLPFTWKSVTSDFYRQQKRTWQIADNYWEPPEITIDSIEELDKFIKKDRLFVVHDNVFFNQHNQVICSGRGQTIRPA